MDKWHRTDALNPLRPVGIVDQTNEVHQDLTKNWLRLFTSTDSRDNRIHVDAKTGEVHHGLHSTHASNWGLPFGLVRIGEIQYVLRSSFYLTRELLFNKDFLI